MRTLVITLGLAATVFAGIAISQQPAKPPAASAAVAPPPDTYTYEAQGRRDPFLPALGNGGDGKLIGKRGIGPAGMLVSEITVRGILQAGINLTAMVQGPDMKTYAMHTGDKLLDGIVKAVTPEGLTIVQDVNDPLSLVKTREVRKLLRSREDAKP